MSIVEPTKLIPHKDQSNWYREGVNRTLAREFLRGKPEGTFLIRPRDEEGSYALSIV